MIIICNLLQKTKTKNKKTGQGVDKNSHAFNVGQMRETNPYLNYRGCMGYGVNSLSNKQGMCENNKMYPKNTPRMISLQKQKPV